MRDFSVKTVLLLLLLFAGIGATALSLHYADTEPAPELSSMFEAREQFTYEVRYGFMRLGNVYVSARDTLIDGKKLLHTTATIQSNSGIPLMGSRRYEYHSLLAQNDSTVWAHKFWVDNVHRERFPEYAYHFDYERGHIVVEKYDTPADTLELPGLLDGGPALFYVGRNHAGMDTEINYPIFIDEEVAYVNIRSTTERDRIRSEALGNEMRDVYLSFGDASIDGPFGFSGKFESRYDTGTWRLPIEARVSVWIGNVRIRLKDYHKNERSS
ncbi:hypothetical protein CYPRO_2259 [Cyclonatronum proteinivorum]|uniref:DUF3108 domain-containing protein n=1 Tax=Cyclonatronum proteinivorum TaxID=1457365 RepID=A0A345UM03_9BACT|nr:hypothetical protein [Cyclonatronum proteinivorum]AXJ01505.1 hypothetical protein CYPRO_2259 [Cyclonatronum proteinivorum]